MEYELSDRKRRGASPREAGGEDCRFRQEEGNMSCAVIVQFKGIATSAINFAFEF
jgi:hypothetical protein